MLSPWELVRTLGGLLASSHPDLERVVAAARRQSWLTAKICFLDRAGQLVAHGRSVLLFIRSSRAGMVRSRAAKTPVELRRGSDYLREIVHGLWAKDQPVFLVPLAIFRGSGLRRKGSRLASFVYSVHEAPSDVKKLATYFWNARDLTISVGAEIPLNVTTLEP